LRSLGCSPAPLSRALILDALVHLPLVLPPVVTGWLLLIAFGPFGPVGRWLESWFGVSLMFRWTGAALAAAIMALPLMVRAMRLSIEGIDRRLEGAARTLGAGPWRSFWTISLPLALPGVLAALVLGFARSIGEFGATITFVSNIPAKRARCRSPSIRRCRSRAARRW
jgi:molybdate transport system permease protein